MEKVSQVESGKKSSGIGQLLQRLKGVREFNLIVFIALISIVMTFASPYFLTWENIKAIMLSFATDGIVVIGMTVMLVLGGIDLSVGSVMCLAMVIAGKMFLLGVNPWLASVVAIAIAAGIGLLIGIFVTKIELSHFITTLAVMGIARGVSFVITKGTPLSLFTLPASFKFIGQGTVLGIPFVILLFLVIVIVNDFMLRNTSLLRKVFYTGSNEKAAVFSGIDVKKVKIAVSVFTSALAAIAGIIYMSRFGAATPGFGVGLEMTAISAAVIGGASLNGGRGTILGSILGVALLSIITSSMILLDVSVYWQDLIKGLILIFAVSVDQISEKRKAS